jgi:GTPase SAR1 family protein
MPESPSGLTLWAETAAACGLDEEAASVLRRLAACVPWRHDVWIALARGSDTDLDPAVEDGLQRASEATDPATRRDAAFCLADRDLARGTPHRGLRWLDRVPQHATQADPELALRRAECYLALGHTHQAQLAAARLPDNPMGERECLLLARLAHHREGVSQEAVTLALRAHVLAAPGAEALLLSFVAECRDASLAARIRRVIEQQERASTPTWQAAFRYLDGDYPGARAQLLEVAGQGDAIASRTLLSWAACEGDFGVVEGLAQCDALSESERGILRLARSARTEPAVVLREAVTGQHAAMERWSGAAVRLAVESLLPDDAPADWPLVFEQLRHSCDALAATDVRPALDALAQTDRHLLRIAVLGEFSVGKTTLMNAWLGAEVGAVGIRPTTSYATWLRHAPDNYARIDIADGQPRILPHAELRGCLRALDDADVLRVTIFSDMAELRHLALLDTPGFNSGEATHEQRAKAAIAEADLIIWLSDATAPLKDSEWRILSDIVDQRIGLQLVLSKADRLDAAGHRKVLHYVERQSEKLGMTFLAPPFSVSARDALARQLAGASEAAGSRLPAGWDGWRRFVDEQLIDRRSRHTERSLRRRARAIVERLLEAEQAHEQGPTGATSTACKVFAERCHAHPQVLAGEMADGLTRRLQDLRDDLEPLRHLAEEKLPSDARDYIIERSLARLHGPLCDALAAAAGDATPRVKALARPFVHGVIVTAAAAKRTPLTAADLRAPLAAIISEIGAQLDAGGDEVNTRALRMQLKAFAERLDEPLGDKPGRHEDGDDGGGDDDDGHRDGDT